MAFGVTDYKIFTDASTRTDELKNDLTEVKSSLNEEKNKLSDETIFFGPIRNECIEQFGNMDESIASQISVYETVTSELNRIPEDYKNGDKEAADKVIDLSSAISTGSPSDKSLSAGISKETKAMIEKAMSVLDSKYTRHGYNWTGDVKTSEFTCSGLIDYAIGCDSQTHTPQTLSDEVIQKGNWKSDVSEFKRGDLVFYYYDNELGGNCEGVVCGHVGIYLGDGKVIDASTEADTDNDGVKIRDVNWMPVYGGGSFY